MPAGSSRPLPARTLLLTPPLQLLFPTPNPQPPLTSPSLPRAPSCLPLPPAVPPAVIKEFCKQLGADNKQVQWLIRLAKKNGEKLGFLA